ncbi:MAG: ABC-F family ATP-binding cassette domain-containing protein [Tannerellaceae bacterium]|jgi:ATP-binding cassette subfamily F protein 3|nr:ABC-F family ATP-binding cassette domain-containing protein [Tannerellaceae bacterium]
MISIDSLTVDFGGFNLFDDISFVINKKDRIALVGRNGAGKTTLLSILAGLRGATSGTISIPKDLTVGYLPQQMQLEDTRSVRAEAERAFEHIHELEREIDRLNKELSSREDYDSDAYHRLIEQSAQSSERFMLMGGNTYLAEVERTLLGLGFSRSDFDRPTSEFSGGWRMRIELARLLLTKPDILLLDEPTNHLDIESIQWLETFIATHANAVVVVSHDREFINRTTFRTIEIELGKIYDYKVKYSEYVELRRERLEQQQRAYENQKKKLAETELFIERFRYKATKAVQVQSRIKQLNKIERIEIDQIDNSAINLKFPPAPRSGTYPLVLEDVAKQYDRHLVFSNVNLSIRRGEKVAFVGKNGEGKSTLIKCITGEIEYAGKLTLGHNVRIGYFAQNESQRLDENLTVFDTIDYVAQGDIRTKIRDILGAFMFGGEAAEKRVGVLSGGERSRLAMIRLLLNPVNLLILDEPTNHLDMRSKDVLKNALKDFEGAIIVVSHDRDFLDGLVEKVYEFGGGRVVEHLGGIYEFLERKKIENLNELERKTIAPSSSASAEQPAAGKTSYEARKEQSKALRRVEKSIAEAEAEIESLEAAIAALESRLSTSEGAADATLYAEHGKMKSRLDEVIDKWTSLSEELERAGS